MCVSKGLYLDVHTVCVHVEARDQHKVSPCHFPPGFFQMGFSVLLGLLIQQDQLASGIQGASVCASSCWDYSNGLTDMMILL